MEVERKHQPILFAKLAFWVFFLLTIVFVIPCVSRTDTTQSDLHQGIEYVKLRLYPQAVDTFRSILSRHPTDINTLYELGNVYKLQDKLELAIETFNKILHNTPSKNTPNYERFIGFTHLVLSEIYCKQSKLELAEQHANKAVQINPTHADTHYRLGFVYTHQAKFDQAHTAFNKTLALRPDFTEVHEWLGLIALMQQKPHQAVTHYKIAIKKKPYVQSAYYNLAKAYRLLGEMDSAKQQLQLFNQMKDYYDKTYAIEGLLAEDPSNAELRLKLAEIHLTQKNISAAMTAYQALIRLNPEFVDGYDKLGRLYMNLNLPQRAIPLFHKVLQLKPNTVEAHIRLGWLYTSQKTFDKAESHLKMAIQKMPKLTLAYHGLAEIYTQQGRINKAVQTYQHITKIDPNDKDAWSALHKLQVRQKEGQTER